MSILINKSLSADTRSATTKIEHKTLLASSHQHINDVQKAIHWMQTILGEAALKHDWTKITYIDEFFNDFSNVQNNKGVDFKKSNWFNRHVTSERHHVNDCCPKDINLFDLLERIADITMAGMARTGTVYDDDLDTKILLKAYKNTIKLLKNNIIVGENKQ